MIVLSGYGFSDYLLGFEEGGSVADLQMGLRILMSIANIVGILLVILCLVLFPLHGDAWKKLQHDLNQKRNNLNYDL